MWKKHLAPASLAAQGGLLESVCMPPPHGLATKSCTATEHDVLVPAAASVHTSQKAQGTSHVRHATSDVDYGREECQVIGLVPTSWEAADVCDWRTTRGP